mmetsp:Transcript_3151/g.4837  ORF Transcript_3151/g.4837 Transcript_3151/m.4837 type:complete len:143 (-) Transcript_3151:311-739(-)
MALERLASIHLLGRILLASVFVLAAINKIPAENFSKYSETLREKGVPSQHVPTVVMAALSMELLGGFLLLTGIFPRFGASLLVVFLSFSSPTMHQFWRISDPAEQTEELSRFMKNVALVGSLFCFISVREKPPSPTNKTKSS